MNRSLSHLQSMKAAYERAYQRCAPIRTVVSPLLRGLASALLRFRGFRVPPEFPLWARLEIALDLSERDTLALLRRIIKPGMCIVDAGANIGYYSRRLSRMVGPGGRVYAFEPAPDTLRYLRANTRRRRNVEVCPCAISDREGQATFYLHPVSCASNSLVDLAESARQVDVPLTSLDRFVDSHNIRQVDLVKIDIEGGEIAALKGMRELARRQPSLTVILEYCPHHIRKSGLTRQEFFSELHHMGFCVHTITSPPETVDLATAPSADRYDLKEGEYLNLLCVKDPDISTTR